MDELDSFVSENKVHVAVLTVPSRKVNDIANKVVNIGIKGIWNFSPMDLNLGEDIVVENVHLSDSLMVLGYNLKDNKFQ